MMSRGLHPSLTPSVLPIPSIILDRTGQIERVDENFSCFLGFSAHLLHFDFHRKLFAVIAAKLGESASVKVFGVDQQSVHVEDYVRHQRRHC